MTKRLVYLSEAAVLPGPAMSAVDHQAAKSVASRIDELLRKLVGSADARDVLANSGMHVVGNYVAGYLTSDSTSFEVEVLYSEADNAFGVEVALARYDEASESYRLLWSHEQRCAGMVEALEFALGEVESVSPEDL